LTPLPPPLGGKDLVAWRLDLAQFGETWASGEGAFRVGGRWNSRGVRAVYCSIDPSTAILEVAVHKGFRALDMCRMC
jgi:RES domain-containing protein